jgi:hypothetical protein
MNRFGTFGCLSVKCVECSVPEPTKTINFRSFSIFIGCWRRRSHWASRSKWLLELTIRVERQSNRTAVGQFKVTDRSTNEICLERCTARPLHACKSIIYTLNYSFGKNRRSGQMQFDRQRECCRRATAQHGPRTGSFEEAKVAVVGA